jgi:hypothetical protein
MNFKKSALASAITLATFATGAAAFDASNWEVSGFVKNETAALQGSGTFIGQATSTTDTASKNDGGDVIKFENTAKVFVNGDLTENAALHAELNFVYDTEATPNDYQGHMNYSQNDYLRELYVDTMAGETEVRVGKQQIVWGTADGIKLLDIINPTDYREFAQNTMEDSRIPVWMIKADAPVGEAGSLQVVISQAEENKIAGLGIASGSSTAHTNNDAGNPFIMKGVDTITGKVNGFLNIAPAIGKVATYGFGGSFGTPGTASSGVLSSNPYYGYNQTVYDYVTNNSLVFNQNGTSPTSWITLCGAANSTGSPGGQNNYVTNLCDSAGGDGNNPNNAFEFMTAASFTTFDTLGTITSEYRVETPDDTDANFGMRFKNSTDEGTNYSFNYLYSYDANPSVDLHWEDPNGNKLYVGTSTSAQGGTVTTQNEDVTSVHLFTDSSQAVAYSSYANAIAASSFYAYDNGAPNLVFTQKYNRIHNVGGSFDTTIDNENIPVVVRGEFLYQKDVKTPVIDRKKLGYGDLVGALKMESGDYFKYVLGADVTLLTNMLVSGQFIQFRNLDYVDEAQSCSTQHQANCGRYTADMAAMHLSNGLQKARENKEFYSLFLSKPFGPNQLGRWNNIFMFEEGGGKWNRFDVEYSFSDELVGSFELNNYWGDTNTQFGQMEDSSNIQVGLKYLF